jgi:hypothetical protein
MAARTKLLTLLALLLAATVLIFRRSPTPKPRFDFENKPRAILSDIKIAVSQEPQLARSPSGVLSVLVVAGSGDKKSLIYSRSQDDGDNFTPPIRVNGDGEGVVVSGENLPSLVQASDFLYAAWQERTLQGRERVMFARSVNAGESFEKPVEVTDISSPFGGFSIMKAAPNGDIYVAWLDGRDKPEPEDSLGLYLSKSTDRGSSFTANTRIALGACSCCRPAIAFGKQGEVYLAWRKVFPNDIRDVVLAVSRDAGRTFSSPAKVGEDKWVMHGCPTSGPSMANIGSRLYIAWYSEGNQTPGIRVTVSDDGAHTFLFPELASKEVFEANHPQLSVFDGNRILLTFQGRLKQEQGQWGPLRIFVATLDPFGRGAVPEALPTRNNSSLYPSMVPDGPDQIFVAWTGVDASTEQVELCRGRTHSQ